MSKHSNNKRTKKTLRNSNVNKGKTYGYFHGKNSRGKNSNNKTRKLAERKKDKYWTDSGNVKAKARKKHSTFKEDGKGKFPIFDKKSARSALRLRGRAPKSQRDDIIRRAKEFIPEEAKKARERDKKKNK